MVWAIVDHWLDLFEPMIIRYGAASFNCASTAVTLTDSIQIKRNSWWSMQNLIHKPGNEFERQEQVNNWILAHIVIMIIIYRLDPSNHLDGNAVRLVCNFGNSLSADKKKNKLHSRNESLEDGKYCNSICSNESSVALICQTNVECAQTDVRWIAGFLQFSSKRWSRYKLGENSVWAEQE